MLEEVFQKKAVGKRDMRWCLLKKVVADRIRV